MTLAAKKQGLYDPIYEHDACGIGAVVNINGHRDHSIIEYGKEILHNLRHRGAAGADNVTGDGAGIVFTFDGLNDVHLFFARTLLRLIHEMNCKKSLLTDQLGDIA